MQALATAGCREALRQASRQLQNHPSIKTYKYSFRPDRVRLDSLGDSDPLLCALGHAELEDLAQYRLFASIKISGSFLGSPFGGTLSLPFWDMPALHNLVQRMPPVAPLNAKPEAARFVINWLSAAGTGVVFAAILTGFALKLNAAQWKEAATRTMRRMTIPILVIGQVLGLGYLTRYCGTDAVLGLAFTSAGFMYPFFAAYLGWLGVFLTGSDTASNALFGSLQRITAQQLHLNEILIMATNSTGGVMGKMIDAQSIMVACAACYDDPYERSHAMGPIFRKVFWHSIALAAIVGVIVMLQAYVFHGMIPCHLSSRSDTPGEGSTLLPVCQKNRPAEHASLLAVIHFCISISTSSAPAPRGQTRLHPRRSARSCCAFPRRSRRAF